MVTAPIESIQLAAKKAGMRVPENPRNYNRDHFPHFHVFFRLQYGHSMSEPDEHWKNAQVIAKVPSDQIRTVSLSDLVKRGYIA